MDRICWGIKPSKQEHQQGFGQCHNLTGITEYALVIKLASKDFGFASAWTNNFVVELALLLKLLPKTYQPVLMTKMGSAATTQWA